MTKHFFPFLYCFMLSYKIRVNAKRCLVKSYSFEFKLNYTVVDILRFLTLN
jgi:hypothetical protein